MEGNQGNHWKKGKISKYYVSNPNEFESNNKGSNTLLYKKTTIDNDNEAKYNMELIGYQIIKKLNYHNRLNKFVKIFQIQ